MTIEPRARATMHRRLTAYEVIARCDDGTEHRLAFSERSTKSVLLSIAQQNSEMILVLLGSWDGEATYTAQTGWTFGPVRVCYSGQTERDCATV